MPKSRRCSSGGSARPTPPRTSSRSLPEAIERARPAGRRRPPRRHAHAMERGRRGSSSAGSTGPTPAFELARRAVHDPRRAADPRRSGPPARDELGGRLVHVARPQPRVSSASPTAAARSSTGRCSRSCSGCRRRRAATRGRRPPRWPARRWPRTTRTRTAQLEPGLGLVSALVPDVSILHAPAADPFGNVLLRPPLMENAYGALAARRGAIVTVERIVEPRLHSRARAPHPASRPASSRAVVEAPLGGHPGGLVPTGLRRRDRGIRGRLRFWLELRAAGRETRGDGRLDRASGSSSRARTQAYVARLGAERIAGLRRRIGPGDVARRTSRRSLPRGPPCGGVHSASSWRWSSPAANPRRADPRGGAPGDPGRARGWPTWPRGSPRSRFATRASPVDLAAEMGLIGYWPVPGEPLLFNPRNFPGCTMLADIDFTLAILVGGVVGARHRRARGGADRSARQRELAR